MVHGLVQNKLGIVQLDYVSVHLLSESVRLRVIIQAYMNLPGIVYKWVGLLFRLI